MKMNTHKVHTLSDRVRISQILFNQTNSNNKTWKEIVHVKQNTKDITRLENYIEEDLTI